LHRSALLGQSLTWRLPGSADFQLILLRVRLGLRLGLGGGSPSRSVLASSSFYNQKTNVFKMARPLYRLIQTKNRLLTAVCRASCVLRFQSQHIHRKKLQKEKAKKKVNLSQ
jgi:hypothetical protein